MLSCHYHALKSRRPRKWRTEDIFATLDDWNKCYDSLTDKLDFSMYEGKLDNADTLLECYEKLNAVVRS